MIVPLWYRTHLLHQMLGLHTLNTSLISSVSEKGLYLNLRLQLTEIDATVYLPIIMEVGELRTKRV